MIDLIKRILVIGGWLLLLAVSLLLLLVLYPLCAGLTRVISAERALWQIIEDEEFKKDSSASASDKQK